MPLKGFLSSISSSLTGIFARAGSKFSTIVSAAKEASTFFVSKLKEKETPKQQEIDDIFNKFVEKELSPDYDEVLQYEISKSQLPLLDINAPIPEPLQINTTNLLKKNYQYVFDFKGAYEGGFKRPSEMVSLLSDNELTIEQAMTKMYQSLNNKLTGTGIGLMEIQQLTLQGVRTRVD